MCQSSLATLASSTVGTARCTNVQRVSKHCATRVKSRSLRSRIPAMYSKCQNTVPHVSNFARYAREFQQEGQKGQRTEPSTGEFHDETASKMTKMVNRRTLLQGNHTTKVAQKLQKRPTNGPFNMGISGEKCKKNDENQRKRVKSPGTPRSTRKRGARLTPVRRRTLPQLSRSLPKV